MVKTKSQKVFGANSYVCRSYRGKTGREEVDSHILIRVKIKNEMPPEIIPGISLPDIFSGGGVKTVLKNTCEGVIDFNLLLLCFRIPRALINQSTFSCRLLLVLVITHKLVY